jgi:catechol 2,3-dioxygenase-like lactoylglutathione lyase family enzyme
MADHTTPNLPSRNFGATSAFYAALGFEEGWRDDSWMILKRGELALEFFPFPDLDPYESSFGACLRLDELDAFVAACKDAGIPEKHTGFPRLHAPKTQPWGARMGELLDPDGTLLHLIQNEGS